MNLKRITEQFFPHLTPAQINNGYCFNWAIASYFELKTEGKSVELFSIPETVRHGSHAFIKVDNLFFDAEATLGVPVWRYIPFVRLYENSRKIRIKNEEVQSHVSLKKFIEYWNAIGAAKNLNSFLEKYDFETRINAI